MLFWGYLSFFVAILTFVFSLVGRSWKLMLLSFITSLPVAYYFLGALSAWRFVAYIPIVLLILTIIFWRINKSNMTRQFS